MKYLFTIIIAGMFLVSCSNSAQKGMTASSNKTKPKPTIETQMGEFALENMLRKNPGVQVRGSGTNATVQIRGINTFRSGIEPLFIVNGTPVGNSYNAAVDLVRSMQIKSVRVLKDSDAAFYGLRGTNGVVLITVE